MTGDKPPLAMTMGDPAGIGPELASAAWRGAQSAPFFILASPSALAARRKARRPRCADHRNRPGRR